MDYAIGDIQGCYRELIALLNKVDFNDRTDRLWLVGDLVNRGPDSLAVLRFLSKLATPPIVTLGNHDLHCLAVYYKAIPPNQEDTLQDLLAAKDIEHLCHWLQQHPLCVYDETLNVFMSHAGLPPCWTIKEALSYSQEVETVLRSGQSLEYFNHMYGNDPALWVDTLTGYDRLRLITNYFTRMRYLRTDGSLSLKEKAISDNPDLKPWFDFERQNKAHADILFGHWAALEGKVNKPGIYALDTGCVWGEQLTALCLQTKIKNSIKAPC